MNENKKKIFCTFNNAPEHRYPGHPESPDRLALIKQWLEKPPFPEMEWLAYDTAAEADVTLVHQRSLLTYIAEECQKGPHEIDFSPTYVTPQSYQAAMNAAGATLAVSRKILSEGRGRGFAIVRPPGHHAEPGESYGFCLLNNIAIAAADAVASGLSRAAIIDFDAHHGNGTEAAFWDTEPIGYFSTHEMDLFPGTGLLESAPHARGRIIDIPLPAFSGNRVFRSIFDRVVTPWLVGFQPEMIFVSAGFDAHFSDPLTTLNLDTKGFFDLASHLVLLADQLCGGRIMFVLEGGYDPTALHDNIQACLAAMSDSTNYEDHYGKGPDVRTDADALIEKVHKFHHLEAN